MLQLKSSVIRAVDYDPEVETLEVRFVTGRMYVYFDVPEQEYGALLTARSAGEYFNTHIRDRYRCEERS